MRDFAKVNKNKYNKVNIEGVVFSHKLQAKVSGERSKNPGTEYITGTMDVALDDNCLSMVPVSFGYVTKLRKDKNGNMIENLNYTLLKRIIDEELTVEKSGSAKAITVRIDGDIECNDFVANNGDMVESQRIRGSFINEGSRDGYKASFDADMLISSYVEREVDNGDNYGTIKGYIFNYRNDFLPVSFTVRIPDGMKYFDNCDISSANPLLTHVWGDIKTTTIQIAADDGGSAFGAVRPTTRTLRSWDIAGAAGTPYEYGDESVMTIDDVKAGLATREQHLAQIRADYENRQKASQNGGTAFNAAAATKAVASDDFMF